VISPIPILVVIAFWLLFQAVKYALLGVVIAGAGLLALRSRILVP
jgi:hypothetical protein